MFPANVSSGSLSPHQSLARCSSETFPGSNCQFPPSRLQCHQPYIHTHTHQYVPKQCHQPYIHTHTHQYVPKLTNTLDVKTILQAIWADLPQGPINKAILPSCKWLHACIKVAGVRFKYGMLFELMLLAST